MPVDRTPQGTLDLQDLEHRWNQCDKLRAIAQDAENRWDRRVLCRRSFNRDAVAGHRAYTAAERYLTIADEHHDALLALLQHHGATPTVPWNLLRPSFEASFYALWLLTPEDSIGRRQRGIRLEWLDDEAAQRYQAVALGNPELLAQLGIPPESVEVPQVHENTQTYRAEADEVALEYDTKRHRGRVTYRPRPLNVERELGTLLPDDPLVTMMLQTTWKSLSGIQHSQGNALLRVSDQAPLGRYPGGQRLLLTINDGAFYLAGLATTMLRGFAWSRYGQCHRPVRTKDPVDLSALRDILARHQDTAG